MRKHLRRFSLATAGLLAIVLTTGCAQPKRTLYHWGSYERQLYEYLKGDKTPPEAQLNALQKEVETAMKTGAALPPGFRSHVGAVQLKLGNLEQARLNFEAEKKSFPESAPYMDFLIRNMAKTK